MDLQLFALDTEREFAESVAHALQQDLGRHEEREFVDGEHKSRVLESVRGADVYLIASLYSDARYSVNDKLVRLLWFVGAIKDAAATRVTAVVPYLCYARKDRKTQARDPVTTRYLARVLEAVGLDRIVTMDVHNLAAYQNAFRIPTEHIEARNLLIDYYARQLGNRVPVIVSPDTGGIKRAEIFRRALNARLAIHALSGFMEKQRSGGRVTGQALIAEVRNRSVIIVDDMISSGGTLARTAEACANAGAAHVSAAVTHGLFVGDADTVLAAPALDELVISNTVPPFRLSASGVRQKLVILDATRLVAETIRRLHTGESIVELMTSREPVGLARYDRSSPTGS